MHDNLMGIEEYDMQVKNKKSKRSKKRRIHKYKNKNKKQQISKMMSKTQGNFFKRNKKIKLRRNNINREKEYAWDKIPGSQTNKFMI